MKEDEAIDNVVFRASLMTMTNEKAFPVSKLIILRKWFEKRTSPPPELNLAESAKWGWNGSPSTLLPKAQKRSHHRLVVTELKAIGPFKIVRLELTLLLNILESEWHLQYIFNHQNIPRWVNQWKQKSIHIDCTKIILTFGKGSCYHINHLQ